MIFWNTSHSDWTQYALENKSKLQYTLKWIFFGPKLHAWWSQISKIATVVNLLITQSYMHLMSWFGTLHINPHCTGYRVIAQRTYNLTACDYPHSTSKCKCNIYTWTQWFASVTTGLYLAHKVEPFITLYIYCYNKEYTHTAQLHNFKCATETISHNSLFSNQFTVFPHK